MSKLWFGGIVASCIYAGKFKKMCDEMELSKLEKALAIARFCEGKTVIQCDDIANQEQQADLIPEIDNKIRSFVENNLNFFTLSEISKICSIMANHQAGIRRRNKNTLS